MNAAIETRRFDAPDQLLDMKEAGGIAIVQLPRAIHSNCESRDSSG